MEIELNRFMSLNDLSVEKGEEKVLGNFQSPHSVNLEDLLGSG